MRDRTLVTAGDWNHSSTDSHYDKTITLNIFRIMPVTYDGRGNVVPGEIVYHPVSGKVWKYRNYDDKELIQKKMDDIGLAVGSLKYYQPK